MGARRADPAIRIWSHAPEASTAHALQRLAWKYRRLLALRQRREEAEAEGLRAFDEGEGRERRRAFARLAREFPGALRELEVLGAAQLRARLEQVEEVLRLGVGPAPPHWIPLVLDYHASLRRALGVKRWLARRMVGQRGLEDEVVEAFRLRLERLQRLGLAPSVGETPGEALRAQLLLHLRPPGGRLLSLVWSELAARHGASPATLEARIFPPAP